MKDFKGKIAVITGAGRGMGRGIALHCAKKGMKIVLADMALQEFAGSLTHPTIYPPGEIYYDNE